MIFIQSFKIGWNESWQMNEIAVNLDVFYSDWVDTNHGSSMWKYIFFLKCEIITFKEVL